MANLIDEILNRFEQEKADKIELERQKEEEKQMFLDAWKHVSMEVIGKSMDQFGKQLLSHHHHISFQRKTPPNHHQTEDSYSIELYNTRLSCRLYFSISLPERKVKVVKHYGYGSRKGITENPPPSKIPVPISETSHEITDITPEFLEAMVAECLKTLLYVTSQP
jgi:hypothetical protein